MEPVWRSIQQSRLTVADYAPRSAELCPRGSWDTYSVGFDRLVKAHGPQLLGEIRLPDLQLLRDRVHQQVGRRVVDDARQRRKPMTSWDPHAHGAGAAENLVRSVRHFFRCAVDDGVLAASPAVRLAAPRRPQPLERPLTESELSDLLWVARYTGDDPELDVLLVRLLRHTACRRAGAVGLTLGSLNPVRGSVTVSEKFGECRELPAGPVLLRSLEQFAHSRGARSPGDAVFRYRNFRPITYRRCDNIFNRLDASTTWSAALNVGCHWLRHTTLTDIAAVSGLVVAAAYAGHRSTGREVTGRYVKVTFEDLSATYNVLFPHS